MTQIHHFVYLPDGPSFLRFNSKSAAKQEDTWKQLYGFQIIILKVRSLGSTSI